MSSKIKVDNISDQNDNNIINESGDVITVGAAGDTVAVAGNIVKSNAYQASDGGNIASQSGTTITLGASGDTISLASGASQSGFGRTGTVDWNTTPKTATFTAVSGEGYFCNTTGGAFTVNLPAGSAGAIVSVADYAATWQTNNLTVSPNGSEKIGGVNANVTLNTEGQSVTFVYVDSTQGWINTMDSTSNARGRTFLAATGGTITTSGDFKIHTFTGPGTFCVSQLSSVANENTVSYIAVAGGGGGRDDGGASQGGAGGGGGGYRENKSPVDTYTASPLEGATDISVTATAFPITVGAGGARQSNPGSDSVFSTVTSKGGGGGGVYNNAAGQPGGSGGGGGASSAAGGSGNTPPVSPPQGNPGSSGSGPHSPGAGGGAGAAGSGGNGGAGTPSAINAAATLRAGGGERGTPGGNPGPGGGGARHQNGTTNTGGGGGGGDSSCTSGSGGSGIVIIRYKFQ